MSKNSQASANLFESTDNLLLNKTNAQNPCNSKRQSKWQSMSNPLQLYSKRFSIGSLISAHRWTGQVTLYRIRVTRSTLRDLASGLLPVCCKYLSEWGFLPDCRSFPVEDVDRNREDDSHESQKCRWPLERIGFAHVAVHWGVWIILRFLCLGYCYRYHLLGTEYIAATPARKSRAKPLPPVAEAEYGPYEAIM